MNRNENRLILIHRRPQKQEGKSMNIMIQTIIRQILIAAGSALVTKGVIDSAQLEAIVGGAIVVIAVAWRYVEVYLSKKKLEAAIVAPAAELPK